MKELIVDLEHCYGIKKLETRFEFEKYGNIVAIYAPNGMMKTSFASTFKDLSQQQTSSDRIWSENATIRSIRDETGSELHHSNIFVIEPYNEKYRSDRISTLLVNDELKERHSAIHKEVDEKSETLLKKLAPLAGMKKGIREELSKAITHDPREFFKALNRIKEEVLGGQETSLGQVIYGDIFNPKVKVLLDDPKFMSKIDAYITKYDELLSRSTFFRRGVFTHNNASDIAKNLNSNGFFKADHAVYLRIKGEKVEITSLQDLEAAIEGEKDAILTDGELKKAFDDIDKQINKNAELKEFRACLEKNAVLLPELSNIELLRQNLWIQYLIRNKDAFSELLDAYDRGRVEISAIIEEAKRHITKWSEVISIFNERFSVPFVVRMGNQEDVILRGEAPSVCFDFFDINDQASTRTIEEDLLTAVLSNGEKRALYILNIIFEVEARREAGIETLFIVDDIADSFDYRNKYAIIEYLAEISSNPNFFQVVLSHNFDFYRTVSGRLNLKRPSRMIASREGGKIMLQSEIYQRNPFNSWRKKLHNDSTLIASVAFLRNMAEFSGDDASYLSLTSLLHVKPDTQSITIKELEHLVKKILQDQDKLELEGPTRKVKDVIYSEAGKIADSAGETAALEEKIVLSIAIRLRAEEYMIQKINNTEFVSSISSNQTVELIKKYKTVFPVERSNIKLFDQVNLMTPENIHLNSFMYEPILDLSAIHLKRIYSKVATLPAGV